MNKKKIIVVCGHEKLSPDVEDTLFTSDEHFFSTNDHHFIKNKKPLEYKIKLNVQILLHTIF